MLKSKVLGALAFFLAVFLLSLLLFNQLIPVAKPRLNQLDLAVKEKKSLNYVALGDSLTEGVGDTSQKGGFVPLLAQTIGYQYGYEVVAKNFGVAGNTSRQILKRLQRDRDLQLSLAKADIMTLTVGGNNIMGVVRREIANLKLSSFDKAAKAYREDLEAIITLARKDNPDLTIYVVGVYNPYYLNFPELVAMQDIINNWNKGTQKAIQALKKVHFVPINDLIYKGIEGGEGEFSGETEGGSGLAVNDALYEKDSFHPNTIGYQIMQGAIMEKMNETNQDWQDN